MNNFRDSLSGKEDQREPEGVDTVDIWFDKHS